MASKKKLTNHKHRLFAAALAAGKNAADAAVEAGYSPRRAKQTGHDLLKREDIRDARDELLRARLEGLGATRERLMIELVSIALTPKTDLVEWGPDGVRLRPSDELTDMQAASVESVGEVISRGGERACRIKQHNKLEAIRMLIQLMGLDPDKAMKLQIGAGDGGGSGELILRWQGPEADDDLEQLRQRWNQDDEES